MIDQGYDDARTLERRARKMEEWLAKPDLMQADADAEYFETIEIDLATIKEPLLACPNHYQRLQAIRSTKYLSVPV